MNLFKSCCRHFQDEKGLSLLEVSIVLAVMGVVGATALPYLSKQRQQSRLTKTLAHQEIVFSSLANYAMTHGKLPCPALKSGQAKASCAGESAVGSVPYETLGLPSHYTQDGWGRDYIYAVNPPHTDPKSVGSTCINKFTGFCSVKDSFLQIYRSFSERILPKDEDPFAVILISRGEAGHHAKGDGEKRNEAKNLTFIDLPYQDRPESPHRHLLRWWTRNNLLAHYAHFSCPGFQANQKIEKESKGTPSDESEDIL